MNKIDTLEEIIPSYEPPRVVVYDLDVDLAFLQDTGSASGFGDGGGW